MARYKEGTLSREEYEEFLLILKESGTERAMDKALDQYWKELEFPQRKEIPELAKRRVKRSRKSYWFGGVAAGMLILLGLFFLKYATPKLFGSHEVVYQTGYGERIEIILDDDSKITLNANSKIQWSNDWRDTRMREIILDGEAFFEVRRRDGIPFTVRTRDVAVEVLGTSFNVDSRNTKTDVYLDEGKVNLKLLKKEDHEYESETKEIIMKPGDQVKYNSLKDKVERTEGQTMITAAAWMNNVLNFKNMKFSEVLNLLREIYGQSFECSDSKLLNTPMYLGVPYSDWDAVRQALELSLNIEFEQKASHRYIVKNLKK